jgi:hypothetical protein
VFHFSWLFPFYYSWFFWKTIEKKAIKRYNVIDIKSKFCLKRRKCMKKFLASLTTAVFALALLSPLAVAIPKHTAQAATTKPLDLYIVMGQSNAAGYSKWEQIAAEDK